MCLDHAVFVVNNSLTHGQYWPMILSLHKSRMNTKTYIPTNKLYPIERADKIDPMTKSTDKFFFVFRSTYMQLMTRCGSELEAREAREALAGRCRVSEASSEQRRVNSFKSVN